jgi:5-methyltetrahydropteroyltriglutamate--homocysteine methyltransferase
MRLSWRGGCCAIPAESAMTPSILTTHTGSLPRPEIILGLIAEREAGLPVDQEAFEALAAHAIDECVEKQLAAGIDIVGDGEMTKPGYSTYVKDRLTGFGGAGKMPAPADLADYPGYARRLMADPSIARLKTPACTGPIAYRDLSAVRTDTRRLLHAVRARGQGAFLTAASPGVIAVFLNDQYYRRREAYLAALADAMRAEYRAIHDAGLILQIDAPDLAMSRHTELAAMDLKAYRRTIAENVEVLNHALADIPPERMRLHLCWGNYEGPHHRDVELKEIIDIVLSARPSQISFPASNPRHEHEWNVWKEIRVPDEKVLLPGVVDTTTNFIEHPELVAERILRFVHIVGPERVIASTDCGFSTFAGSQFVDPSIAWAKLEALAAGARIATATSHLFTGRPSVAT